MPVIYAKSGPGMFVEKTISDLAVVGIPVVVRPFKRLTPTGF
jgi:hypothetical protein